ncbi:MAG: flagellar motor switch protein FliN [bacterium]|nr:flagellar motor switch protein FliN [bacterium]
MAKKNFLGNLKEVLKGSAESIASSLGLALNREIKVRLDDVGPVDPEELQQEYSDGLLYVHSNFSEGLSGELAFLLAPPQAASWADLMMMGDGKADFSPDEHPEAISELLNQVSSAWCLSLSDLIGAGIRLNPFKADLSVLENHAAEWSSSFRADLDVAIDGFPQTKLIILLPPQTIEELQSLMPNDKQRVMDRPPPAVLDDDFNSEDEPEVRSARFEDFGPPDPGGSRLPQNLETLMDLELPVIIELGRTNMFIKDILELSPGAIIELNKLSGEPVDLFVNDKKFARGEVVVIDQNFGIRITDLVKVEDRIHSLR